MTSASTKPYLIRALWEWCGDNGFTPLIQVQVAGTLARVPPGFVQGGQIVLNISQSATRQLDMGNESIDFVARFNGISESIHVPWPAVLGIFARETGEGMAFPLENLPDTPAAATNHDPEPESAPDSVPDSNGRATKKKPSLTVIK